MYDNINNAVQKLQGTFCYYGGRAVYIKEVSPTYDQNGLIDSKGPIKVFMCYIDGQNNRGFWQNLNDPKFQYMEFNIGYINHMGYALWYYRVPHKQWKQGLHGNQVKIRDKSHKIPSWAGYAGAFGSNDATASMLENRYPPFEQAVEMLNHKGILKVAFHKDFAVYKDNFQGNTILEYKGYPVAFESADHFFKCHPDMVYLKESIAEMNLKVA